MPALVDLLLLNRVLKHGLQPTISVPYAVPISWGITQCPPASGSRQQVNLAVKCPAMLVMADLKTHDDSRDVAVRPVVRVVGPFIEHSDAHDAHVEDLRVPFEPGHLPDEGLAPAPGPRGGLREHLPHPARPALGAAVH